MATIYEVSKLAGVSLATVSRVMNQNAYVTDETKKKVLDAMKELDYRPNSAAQSLALNRSDSVGVLVAELDGPFYGPVMSGVESELRKAGKHVIVAAGHDEEETEKEGVEFLIGRGCDALILLAETLSNEYLVELAKGSTPFVMLNRTTPGLESQCISLDNHLGGYMASKLLVDQGHREIAYISGPLWKHDAEDRYAGHKQALEEAGLTQDPELLFESDYREAGGSSGLLHLINSGKKFTALACANDEMASGAMMSAAQKGLSIPQDLSIVGFDNVHYARLLTPSLTTVEFPIHEMGKMAARWVLKNAYGKKKLSYNNYFSPKLIQRHSSKAISS
ncbi:LacI family transcriptional regulator [Neiella marina]|uniref:LacI family transcriptional regulator n=1 Tax=Neiella holothuriorum TaxID=2870530 RepID=A0ABS7ECB6_9GAMM|nr:LacI family DNA-binding transcriptional regulator [Neiella holothuriorum]MBW8189860.1 LacI family transcriptional regulator [Neiella holothuriorum]